MEGIILAGGLGTRLQSVVSDVPKCMAPVAGKPFLHYLLNYVEKAGFTRIILSLGYKHEIVEEWVEAFPTRMKIICVVENEPLGTGGAIKLASEKVKERNIFILNGDTFFRVNFVDMMHFHLLTGSQATIALRKMENFDRYGVVTVDMDSYRITGFQEKQFCEVGYINGGIYLIKKEELSRLPVKCSLEKDYFEACLTEKIFSGFCEEGYFIDMGLPEDYARVQEDFSGKQVF